MITSLRMGYPSPVDQIRGVSDLLIDIEPSHSHDMESQLVRSQLMRKMNCTDQMTSKSDSNQ